MENKFNINEAFRQAVKDVREKVSFIDFCKKFSKAETDDESKKEFEHLLIVWTCATEAIKNERTDLNAN